MIHVTNHAALRYVQRSMNLCCIESLSEKQEDCVKATILQTILPIADIINDLKSGEFKIDNVTYVVQDKVIVTVTTLEAQPHIMGGARKSGRKVKKLLRSNKLINKFRKVLDIK